MFEETKVLGKCACCKDDIISGYEGYMAQFHMDYFCSIECILQYYDIKNID